jgi:WD40 repeat protein
MLSAVVVAASVAAAGIGIGVPAPVGADPPSQPAKPAAPPPAEVAQPRPALDRYGDPLPDGAVARFGSIRFRHGGPLQSIAYSPDGKTIASGGTGRIMLWESETGKPIASLMTKSQVPPARGKPPEPKVRYGGIFGLAFTPEGKWLVSVGSPGDGRRVGQFSFWEMSSPKQEGWLTEHIEPGGLNSMQSVAVSPDGKTAAVGNDSGTLLIVDTKTLAIQPSVKCGSGVTGLSFAPDGKTLAVATSRRVILLDPATRVEVKRLELDSVRQVAFARDGKAIWVGCDGGNPADKDSVPGSLRQWDLQTGTVVQTFETVPGQLLSLAISPDGKTLASGGRERGPFLWDAVAGKAVDLDPPGPQQRTWWLNGLAFAPDGRTLAVADSNGQVRVWDVATRRELHRHNDHIGGILNVSLSPDGKQAATVGWDGTVRIWDVATGQAVRFWNADATASVNYTPDGRSLLTAGWGGTVRLWDAATGKEVRRFRDERGFARAAVSPDGRLVAASGKDLVSITLYETATGRPIRELTGHTSSLSLLTFSPDSRQLISAADMFFVPGGQLLDDRSVRVWDVATGLQVHKIDSGRPQRGAAVSPDGRVVAVGVELEEEKTKYLRFWDTVTGKELVERRMKDFGWPAFSPDGRYLATAKLDDIRVVEVASGRVVQAFEGVGASVNGMTFTPDGRRLVSAHDDGTALVWDSTPRPMNDTNPTKLWDELASDNAGAAQRAGWTLAADPVATVTLLSEKLKTAPKRARTTASLIADLNAQDFQTREAASRELVSRVNADSAELTAALAKSPSAETRQRLGEILRSGAGPWPTLDAEDLRRVRAVGVLEAIGTPEARRILKALADGDPYAHLTRVARAAARRLGD